MNFSLLTYNVTTSNSYYQIPSDLDDGVWYWRVRGKDDAGNWGYWSAIWWFQVDTVEVPELTNVNLALILLMSGLVISLVIFRRRKK